MKLEVRIADPAGNITALVMGNVPEEKRKSIAELIMTKEEPAVEQVGFCYPCENADGHLEMAGGEFCGNASRAYAMLLCGERQTDKTELTLEVSGCSRLIKARVNTAESYAEAEMPIPEYVGSREVEGKDCTLVHLGGIAHLIMPDTEADMESFEKAEKVFDEFPELEAYGVMFLDRAAGRLTPIVKVKEINSLYWEGSCASGSIACAIAESNCIKDGTFSETYSEPSGRLTASVRRENGAVVYTAIGGTVLMRDSFEIDI